MLTKGVDMERPALRKLGFRKRGTDIVYPEYTWRLDME